jgi:hypothetical protein
LPIADLCYSPSKSAIGNWQSAMYYVPHAF